MVAVAVFSASTPLAHAQGQSEADARRDRTRERAKEVESAATDPSLRSAIATPRTEFIAEIAEDKKKATAKMGFDLRPGLTGEVGFTGAFDSKGERSRITSLRELSPGSTGWFALTFKKYRLKFDWLQMNVVCRQAAWAAGERFQDYDCRQSTLPSQSFAARLAELAASPAPARLVCQQFLRAVLPGSGLSEGNDFLADCDEAVANSLRTKDVRFSATYADRFAAAGTDASAALAVCNEFRRSRGWPLDPECDPTDLEGAEKDDFAKSWEQRFNSPRSNIEAEICDEYRRAKGELPTGTGGCAPGGPDPLFDQSLQERLASSYRWLATPILGLKTEVGRATFKYRDDVLAETKETHSNYSVTGTLGVLTAQDVIYAVNYSLGRSYKAGDPTQLCQPLDGHDATTCESNVILSGPTQENRHQLELQLKGYLGPDVGAQLFVTRDLKKDAWGFEVPLYFLKNGDGGLAGGLVLSYRTDKKSFEASVFIGQVFSVFD